MSDGARWDGRFALADAFLAELAEQRETPLFVYSGAVVRASYRALRAALPERARIAYAVKANPHPSLLRALADLGASFDCASSGELERVAPLAVSPDRILFAGPGKRTAELRLGLAMGARFQAEGLEDLLRLDQLADRPLAVNLRVHPAATMHEDRPILGGSGPSAFGIDEEDLEQVLERARGLHRVRIRGLHVFAASNQRSAAALLENHRRVFELARRLQDALDEPLEQIDLGGGLGIPYAPGDGLLDLGALSAGLSQCLAQNPWFGGELLLEPGRYLAGPAGVYLARVVRTKTSRGTHFAILEGGVNHLLRPLLTGEPFPVRPIPCAGAQRPGLLPLRPTTLAGPLCTSLDRLGSHDLPPLEPGDLLAFGQVGAYGFTEGMTHFLSHPVPKELWVEGDPLQPTPA